MKRARLEICCGSADDVIQAGLAGADRVELNEALFLGGLTATPGQVRAAKDETDIEILAMVRPREGGFCYTDAEFQTMLYDAQALLDAGADGIVFGILNEDGTVDERRCEQMLRVIGNKPTVFHRAIDVTPDWRAGLDSLIRLGFTRVLTSGQEPSALYGAATIKAMRERAANRIEILPGAGIRPGNVHELIEKTGCDQVHLSLRRVCVDGSTAANESIHFGGALYPPEDKFMMTDCGRVREFIQALEG